MDLMLIGLKNDALTLFTGAVDVSATVYQSIFSVVGSQNEDAVEWNCKRVTDLVSVVLVLE